MRALAKISKEDDINLPYDKIILPQELKDRFEKSTFGFLEDEKLAAKFKKYMMRMKRCVLLFGPPGCGKSTLVTWLRAEAQARKWQIFGWENLNSEGYLGRDKMAKTLFILEDIDCVLTRREKNIHDARGTQYSRLLNLMDGSEKMNNYVIVMTANHPELLDPAVLRDGRADEKLNLPYPTRELKERYIDVFIRPMDPKMDLSLLEPYLKRDDVPYATLDNIRKKIFIYGSIEKALSTFKTEVKEEKKYVGFRQKKEEE